MNLAERMAQADDEGWSEWIRTEADEKSVLAGCRFDIKSAERVRTFFHQFLRHSKGEWAGQPFELLDWQWQDIIAPLFGWLRADGTRRYRRGYIEVPKKNGKSTLVLRSKSVPVGGRSRTGAEVYSAAVDREQASIVFREAANMVETSRIVGFAFECRALDQADHIPSTPFVLSAVSADVPAQGGT